MPEIIQFSNNLCYRTEPLVPVRQFGAGRLAPTVLTRHITSGYLMPGRRNQNQPEAEAIVEQIVRCCDDRAYDGKTMGVISLVGEEQAKLIERMLTQRLGPEQMEARRLDCGDAYAFQGAERDVMFLSLVAAPDPTRRIATQTDEATKRRFNVAASRARDQMWLFHTALLSDLNSKEDLKYRLLDYCLNPHLEPAAGAGGLSLEELIRRAAERLTAETPPPPFDSWFEVDVFIRLAQAGYRVLPQYELGGYRVDLLVEGMRGRIAVECDGDQWHGPDRFDEDASRQRDLERCGLHFVRVRGTAFCRDPEATLALVFAELDRNKVRPEGVAEPHPNPIPHEKESAVLDERDVRDSDEWPAEDPEEAAQPPVADDLTAPDYSGPNYRAGVQPYREWRLRPLPSPSSQPSAILDGLVEIVTQEGPIVIIRAFQLYVRAAGGRKVGSSIREALQDAVSLGQRRGALVSKAELDGGGPLDAVLRIPGTPDVVLREAGPRESIQEIPPAEIGALMHHLTRGSWPPTGETLYRAVLARYGKVRLTEQTLAHLARIERRYLQNRESGGPPALNS
jgi:very-short-patch-repair endonuclease